MKLEFKKYLFLIAIYLFYNLNTNGFKKYLNYKNGFILTSILAGLASLKIYKYNQKIQELKNENKNKHNMINNLNQEKESLKKQLYEEKELINKAYFFIEELKEKQKKKEMLMDSLMNNFFYLEKIKQNIDNGKTYNKNQLLENISVIDKKFDSLLNISEENFDKLTQKEKINLVNQSDELLKKFILSVSESEN